MMCIGFKITVEELLRLFELGDPYARSFYDIGVIDLWLKKEKGSKLFIDYFNRDVCVIGIPVRMDEKYPAVEYIICEMIAAKREFLYEMKKMGVDISTVKLAELGQEVEEVLVENPEPYLIVV